MTTNFSKHRFFFIQYSLIIVSPSQAPHIDCLPTLPSHPDTQPCFLSLENNQAAKE